MTLQFITIDQQVKDLLDQGKIITIQDCMDCFKQIDRCDFSSQEATNNTIELARRVSDIFTSLLNLADFIKYGNFYRTKPEQNQAILTILAKEKIADVEQGIALLDLVQDADNSQAVYEKIWEQLKEQTLSYKDYISCINNCTLIRVRNKVIEVAANQTEEIPHLINLLSGIRDCCSAEAAFAVIVEKLKQKSLTFEDLGRVKKYVSVDEFMELLENKLKADGIPNCNAVITYCSLTSKLEDQGSVFEEKILKNGLHLFKDKFEAMNDLLEGLSYKSSTAYVVKELVRRGFVETAFEIMMLASYIRTESFGGREAIDFLKTKIADLEISDLDFWKSGKQFASNRLGAELAEILIAKKTEEVQNFWKAFVEICGENDTTTITIKQNVDTIVPQELLAMLFGK